MKINEHAATYIAARRRVKEASNHVETARQELSAAVDQSDSAAKELRRLVDCSNKCKVIRLHGDKVLLISWVSADHIGIETLDLL